MLNEADREAVKEIQEVLPAFDVVEVGAGLFQVVRRLPKNLMFTLSDPLTGADLARFLYGFSQCLTEVGRLQ